MSVALLIIDEVGFQPLSRQEASLLFRLVSYRYGRGSILITANKAAKGMPIKDVAEAGGWCDTATLLRSYQRSDEATVTQVVLEAPKLTAAGRGSNEVTPLLTPPDREERTLRAGND